MKKQPHWGYAPIEAPTEWVKAGHHTPSHHHASMHALSLVIRKLYNCSPTLRG